MKRPARAAFSLLEVLLATGILLGCVTILAELAAIGREHANSAHELATAHRLCANKLSELLSSAATVEEIENLPLEEEEGWVYSVAVEATAQVGLAALRVTVARDPSSGQRSREFTLVRWILTPANAVFTDTWTPAEPPSTAPAARSSSAIKRC